VTGVQTCALPISAKIAHPLVMQLRGGNDSANEKAYADLIKRIFKMKDTD
jgi:hypothetical protein